MAPGVDDTFDAETLDPRWTRTCPGGGTLALAGSALRLALPGAASGRYSDAQIDDYDHLPPARFPWRPPLRMEVRARASHVAPSAPPTRATRAPLLSEASGEPQAFLRGTFGFGFWNYPFSLSGHVLRLPDAVWFFGASLPSNMALVPGVPGWGWKAQVVHSYRWQALAFGLPTLPAVAWARLSGREALAARWIRRVSGAAEQPLEADLRAWHTYTIDWLPEVARFAVDGTEMLAVPDPPRGPLGFVAWIDNQYAVATPRGAFGFGTLASGPEWLELDTLKILPA
jgi:hypothetical protein